MSAGISITRLDQSARDLRAEAGKTKDGRVSRRLLALALVLEGKPRKAAAEACGMDRQTLRDWVHRYNEGGVAGLSDRRGGISRSLLDAEQMAKLGTWIEAGPDPERDGVVRWRQRDLAAKIKAEFDVDVHERTVGGYLARLGYVRLTVRPEHPKASSEAQETFKKTSPKLSPMSCPITPSKSP